MIIPVARFALLLSVVVVAACSGDAGEPSALPDIASASSTSTHTPTESPAVEPPVEPDNAHEYSAEGVEAFTLYAIEVINYAYRTNDVSYLKQIMSPDCQFCERTIDRLVTIGDAGGRIEGGRLVPALDVISITGPTEGVQTSAGIEMSITPSTTFDGHGEVRDRQPNDDFYAIVNLSWQEDQWRLDEIFRTDSPRS